MIENAMVSGCFPYNQEYAPIFVDARAVYDEMKGNKTMEMTELLGLAPEGFYIDNDSKADWAVEIILEAEAERDRLIELANAKIKAINDQKAQFTDKCANNTSYLRMLLRNYFESVKPSTSTKTQETYKLVSGKLVLKRQAPEFVRDDKVMVEWAESSAPDYIKVKKEINWADLKKATTLDGETVVYAETGEVVPGVVAKAREDVFEVAK